MRVRSENGARGGAICAGRRLLTNTYTLSPSRYRSLPACRPPLLEQQGEQEGGGEDKRRGGPR